MIVLFHGEADVTIATFLLDATKSSQSVTRILSDDTDVFVLLAYWMNPTDLQCKVHVDRWDGSVLVINATCVDLGLKYLQLLSCQRRVTVTSCFVYNYYLKH